MTSETLISMKSAIAARPDTLTIVRSRSADYLELIRPRIASMVLFTVAAGFCLAEARTPDLARLLHTLFGTALVLAWIPTGGEIG
jgi:heme o synthase